MLWEVWTFFRVSEEDQMIEICTTYSTRGQGTASINMKFHLGFRYDQKRHGDMHEMETEQAYYTSK